VSTARPSDSRADIAVSFSPPETFSAEYKLRFLLEQSIGNSIAVTVVGLFIVLAIARDAGWLWPLLWLAFTAASYFGRSALLRRHLCLDRMDVKRTERVFMFSTVAVGMVASSCAPIFFAVIDDVERMYVTMILCCWLAGAMASIGAHARLFLAYSLVFLSLLTLGWWIASPQRALFITLMLILYGAVINRFARNFAHHVEAGIDIRFQNEALIAKLREANAEAVAAVESKSRFLAAASHDLRQPLHALSLLAGLLDRTADPARLAEVALQVRRSVNSLERLFTSILDLSKLDVGMVKAEKLPVDLKILVEELALQTRQVALGKGVMLVASAPPLTVLADPEMLNRVLRNLLDNAVKFSSRGQVRLEALLGRTGLVISVEDEGLGVPEQLHEAIFNEFVQVEQAHGSTRGLGLGLAIARRFAKLMGMTLVLERSTPLGSRFELHVPLDLVQASPPMAQLELAETVVIPLDGMRVALIDDDAEIRNAMHLLLQSWRCDVLVCGGWQEYRDVRQRMDFDPDVVLLDYGLGGGVSGLEVANLLREDNETVPIALLTGTSDAASRQRLESADYPVLMKPVPAAELRQLLELFREID
jgi:two-component system, sensor histidine kinase